MEFFIESVINSSQTILDASGLSSVETDESGDEEWHSEEFLGWFEIRQHQPGTRYKHRLSIPGPSPEELAAEIIPL